MTAATLHPPVSAPIRCLAGLLLACHLLWLYLLADVTAGDNFLTPDGLTLLAVFALSAYTAFAAGWVTLTGRAPPSPLAPAALAKPLVTVEPQPLAPHPGTPATAAQRLALQRLGEPVPDDLSEDAARRRINWLEARLPATLEQQRALAAYGSPRGVYTRASAARFLAERAAFEDAMAAEAWAEHWAAIGGPAVTYPWTVDKETRDAFDAAAAALSTAGLAWPYRPLRGRKDVDEETDLLRRAARFVAEAREWQEAALEAGDLRVPVGQPALRRVFADYARLLQADADQLESADIWLALLQKAQPGVLTPQARGFELAAGLRTALARCQFLLAEADEDDAYDDDDDGDYDDEDDA